MRTFDFNIATFDELDQHAVERLVFDTAELSPILQAHLFIERVLETLISQNLKNPSALFRKRRLTFELKVDLGYSMGLLNEKYVSAFKALNSIRNNYSHRYSYEVSFQELEGLKFDWVPIQREAYRTACVKGVAEATRIASIFLCWKAILLIKEPPEDNNLVWSE